ncbi:MAG: hypothetical protein FJX35_17260 [Alphaproteobacteria bacterium]|nr:hypothetical protein [Alphaproteobacteria bacterium]
MRDSTKAYEVPDGEPVLDTARLDQLRAVLGASGVDELIGAFRRLATRTLVELSPRAERRVVRNAAHALKGTALDIGLMNLGALMRALQDAADGDGELQPLLARVPAAVNSALDALDRLRR